MTKQPDGIFIVAGDFNQADLRSVLPKFQQHVHTPNRGNNTLNHVYMNISGSYKAAVSLLLLPAYTQLIKRVTPSEKTVRVWIGEATAALQDCFECTDWHMLEMPPPRRTTSILRNMHHQ